ncbi:MAG: aldehyde dehydrogenase [Elusimicrobia bacterium]|nr:MAG: aldehyde dehydrogenase [Elusimicrobiota bacterium]
MSRTIRVVNPATNKLIRKVPMDSQASIELKIRRAKHAQTAWAKTPFRIRRTALLKFDNLLKAQKQPLAKLLSLETGKPISQALGEVGTVGGRIRFFVDHAERVLSDETPYKDSTVTETISYDPLGLVANISAWNYPYFVGANVFVPALLTGNAVLYKPSEFSTLTGIKIANLLHKAGVPKNVFIPIIGDGRVGAALIERPLGGIFFTGSYATGSKIAQSASKRLTRVQLELGGKDPAYVMDDADPAIAAAGLADGAFYNTGQSCCAVERIYVHKKVYHRFIEAFVETVRGFKVGDPLDPKTYIGPLTRPQRLAFLENQAKDAVRKGASLITGGRRLTNTKGNYFEPTVLTHCTHKMNVMREETFGPLIGIQKVSSDVEAIRLMKDTEYGLTAGVYSKNLPHAKKVLAEMDAGSVYWNCCDRVSPNLPWSGRGHSGMGCTLSVHGISAFLQPKAWHLRRA